METILNSAAADVKPAAYHGRKNRNAMPPSEQPLLEALLDSWDRSNTILTNLLRIVPADGFAAVAPLFTHIHYVRLVFISEDAPEFPVEIPEQEWHNSDDPGDLAQMLNESAAAVREVVRSKLESNKPMDRHYDHPILFLQHMLWHDAYHHGQIKLTLKAKGLAIPDKTAGPVTWGIWMRKN